MLRNSFFIEGISDGLCQKRPNLPGSDLQKKKSLQRKEPQICH